MRSLSILVASAVLMSCGSQTPSTDAGNGVRNGKPVQNEAPGKLAFDDDTSTSVQLELAPPGKGIAKRPVVVTVAPLTVITTAPPPPGKGISGG